MRKQRKSNKLDRYLVSWKHWWIAVGIVAGAYWVVFSRGRDIINPLFFAVITVWGYISCRKYGWLETLTFVGILPFLFIAGLLKLLPISPGSGKLDYETFIGEVKEEVERAFNEMYTGKIIETRKEEGRIYITVETPFGLHVPENEMIAEIAEHLRISPVHVQVDPISENRKYYVFGPEAVRDYEESRKSSISYRSFAQIKERILCKSPVPINPRSHRE